jgi:hypothetical protein
VRSHVTEQGTCTKERSRKAAEMGPVQLGGAHGLRSGRNGFNLG